MKNQAYRMALLYDFYGDMLTDRQKEFYDLYYNEDLSLAEIAENYGITRQGVRDVIVRAEAILTELEDKTGIVKRFHQMQDQFLAIQTALNGICELNETRYQDDTLEGLCTQIQGVLSQLKQE
ncbi:YlxM family DNA-binding protein [Lawsonibacter celer]|uniref:YlxM family DNA-binding protein n=1 Tax=Lawsonibacter celer TaxID=2986526 RepID=UPI001644B9FB|nr:sigma factor-like helix-turn-helix DNA-binding protein [Lawsonibacter celer]